MGTVKASATTAFAGHYKKEAPLISQGFSPRRIDKERSKRPLLNWLDSAPPRVPFIKVRLRPSRMTGKGAPAAQPDDRQFS
jgi:hypothetical protein